MHPLYQHDSVKIVPSLKVLTWAEALA